MLKRISTILAVAVLGAVPAGGTEDRSVARGVEKGRFQPHLRCVVGVRRRR